MTEQGDLFPPVDDDHAAFLEFLAERIAAGPATTDDVLGAVLPLMHQALVAHDTGRVAPLDGVDAIAVDFGRLWFENSRMLPPRRNLTALRRLRPRREASVEVRRDLRERIDLDRGESEFTERFVAESSTEEGTTDDGAKDESTPHALPIDRPAYLRDFVGWEHAVEHHDPLTDIYSLGMILAALAFGLDFTRAEDVERFAAHHDNLFRLNGAIHPVVVKVIARMTLLDRGRRAQDLPSLIDVLENYRDQGYEPSLDFSQIDGFNEETVEGRRALIQDRLRDRLFEFSRRNRLLYFKNTLGSLDLTVTSVPVLLDYHNIRADDLLTWQGDVERILSAGKPLELTRFVRVKEAPYAPGVLDRIRRQAGRDRKEFGFAQLRLVICFLRWHNLKETPEERIHSPLLLLPVSVEKTKGVQDRYVVKPQSSIAEVNPALRKHLANLYGLELPDSVDLEKTDVATFYEVLKERVEASEPGLTLAKVDRPQIDLIYRQARRRLDRYRQKSRAAGGKPRKYGELTYSYRRSAPEPLGLKLFLNRVRPAPAPFADVFRERPLPRDVDLLVEAEDDDAATNTAIRKSREKGFYVLRQGSDANPYVWDFDLCAVTLGNFNYRKMTLVRDYDRLLDTQPSCAPFDNIFSSEPRAPEESSSATDDPEEGIESVPIGEQYPIVECDRTQLGSVLRARDGESYIIQGPPGTGKSQTITNLIADYVARGKRVLFVCQKRAAIDVVYHRLAQCGLDRLSCLIHDSQEDKKPFIFDLRDVYEWALNTDHEFDKVTKARNRAVRTIERELDALAGLAAWTSGEIAGTANGDGSGVSPRDLFVRLIALPPVDARFDAVRLERVPGYREWTRFGSSIAELSARLEEVSGEPRFARSPFRFLAREVAKTENPLTFVSEQLEAAAAPLRTIRTALEGTPFDGASLEEGRESRGLDTLDDIAEAVAFAARLRTLGRGDLVRALDPESEAARALREQNAEIEERTYRWERAKEENDLWRDKLAPRDARDALALAARVEGKFLAFLRPSWRRLRKILRERYDFDSAFVIRTWVQILGDLCAEYDAHDAVEEAVRTAARRFEVENYSTSIEEWRRLQEEIAELPAASQALLDAAIAGDADTVDRVAELADTLATLESTLDGVWVGGRDLPGAEFDAAREALLAQLNSLPDILPSLESLHDASPELHTLLRQEPLLPDEVEALLATKSIDVATRAHREWGEFDGEALAKALRKVHKAYEQWFELNAQWITAGVGAQFREHALLGDTPDAQLTDDERERKKRYKKGRRELEHEFGKTMRHKSIRDLASDESGEVVRDLKPIWLMSPLSVSDTIPLADSDVACDFDVVIFDEASQVPVEEAVPALYRARQTIVVGDEMQLPPTQFFAAAPGDDATLLIEEEEGEVIEFALDADSFLTQSARNLSSTLLGWHYRSRFEALIGFSNAAFYRGRLRTIPDRRLREREFEPLVLETPDAAAERAAPILERSVSFYHLPNAEYVHRRNPDEARTIAELVRQLLLQDTGKSLGIVAFSEAQQGEIERALAALAADDREFRTRLDAEEEREEDGQFVGLFVKNLENVQGDERDIVLLSVCYGYDERRKMRMNFGPINKNGGEKRLNVIFSRAKERMVVVSSIRGSDITNDYNDGARCLRNYLFYAEAVSTGEWEEAARVLGEMTLDRADDDRASANDAVVDSVAAVLTERGWEVERDVGQSSFRCDLGVRKEGEPEFRLAVVVDTDRHWANRDRLESFYLRPQVLRAFGWNVAFVLARDWYADRDGSIERLEKELRRRRR